MSTTAVESELLQRLRLDAANRAFNEDRADDGVAMLLSLLEDHPTNQAAVLRLHSALLHRNWPAMVTPPLQHEGPICAAEFSPDGTRLVTASDDGTARIWDAGTGRELTAPLRHESRVESAQFSPDGNRLVTASADGTARIWDARTGQCLSEPLRHESGVDSARFSPDGTRVVTVSDATARVWDVPFNCMDLAQLQSYARFVSRKESSPHPPARALSKSEEILLADAMKQLRRTPSAEPVVSWLVADRATRTISPHLDRTMPEHVSHVLDNGTRLEIEALLGYLPMHSGLLTRLATLMVEEEERRSIMPR